MDTSLRHDLNLARIWVNALPGSDHALPVHEYQHNSFTLIDRTWMSYSSLGGGSGWIQNVLSESQGRRTVKTYHNVRENRNPLGCDPTRERTLISLADEVSKLSPTTKNCLQHSGREYRQSPFGRWLAVTKRDQHGFAVECSKLNPVNGLEIFYRYHRWNQDHREYYNTLIEIYDAIPPESGRVKTVNGEDYRKGETLYIHQCQDGTIKTEQKLGDSKMLVEVWQGPLTPLPAASLAHRVVSRREVTLSRD